MATNEDATVNDQDLIGHGAAGKYLLLKVPTYENSGTQLYQASKDTYLNLGRGMGRSNTDAPGWSAQTDDQPSWTASGLNEDATTTPQSGEDLLKLFGGFIDDRRLRETAGTFNAQGTPPNESAARTAAAGASSPTATASTSGAGRNLKVTELIPDYVGWRDHTDGHRITTTRGDKIEIIGGNYKLVSLGRGTGVSSFEMSGGITIGSDEAPGNTTSVTWRPVPTGTSGEKGWKVVEQVVKGNAVERFHGTRREEFYGDKLISVVGSPNEASSGLTVASAADNGNAETYVGDSASYTSTKNVASFEGEALDSYAYPTKWDQEDDVPPKLQRPDVYDSKWVSSINEYTYVTGDAKAQSHFKGEHKERNIFEKGHKTETTMHAVGHYYQEIWHFLGSGGFMERFEGSFLQLFAGASTTIGFANRFELYVSIEEQLNLGFIASLSLGAKLDGSFPNKLQFDLNEEKVMLNGAKVGLKEVTAHLEKQEARIDNVKAVLSDRRVHLSKTNRGLVTNL